MRVVWGATEVREAARLRLCPRHELFERVRKLVLRAQVELPAVSSHIVDEYHPVLVPSNRRRQWALKVGVDACESFGFASNELDAWMKSKGIVAKHTEHAEPYQNGVAEQAHRDTKEAATTLLNEAGLPVSFWPFAATYYTQTKNRTSTSSLPDGDTPFTKFWGRKPDLSKARIFGCLAYALVPADKRKVFDSHYVKCIFLCYSDSKPGCWLFYNTEKCSFFESSQAIFDESVFPGTSLRNVRLDVLPESDGELELDGVEEGEPGVPHEPNPGVLAPPAAALAPPVVLPQMPAPPPPPQIVIAEQQQLVQLPPQPPQPPPRSPSPLRRSVRSTRHTESMWEPDLHRSVGHRNAAYPHARFAEVSELPMDEFEANNKLL